MGHLTLKYALLSLYQKTHHPYMRTNFSHVLRAIFQWSYETFEVTGPQMVLVMKLTTFAWNVHDGRRPAQVRAHIFLFPYDES